MDEYGSMRPCAKDWDTIVAALSKMGSATFCYSGDNGTAFIISIVGPIHSIGIMAWGGQVSGKYLVSVRRRGAEYFELLDRKQKFHPDYIQEKINPDLGDSDCEILADLLNQVAFRLRGANENANTL